MKYIKHLSFVFVVGLLLFSGSLTSHAEEKYSHESLSKQEIKQLIKKVGLTEEEINDFPTEVLRELLDNNAKKISYKKEEHDIIEDSTLEGGTIGTQAIKKGTDLTIGAASFEVTSDRSGLRKFYLYGNFNWLKSPPNRWTDAISIGWPESAELTMPVNSYGDVTQFSAKYMYRDGPYSAWGWQTGKSISRPDYDQPSAGVGFRFNLKDGFGYYEHKGYAGQYVYSKKSSGYFNIMIRYGHTSASITPSFTVYPTVGLGVTPTWVVDTEQSYSILDW